MLKYNENKKMSFEELSHIDEDDFYNMLIEEHKKKPSDAQIIREYSDNIESVIDEMRKFNDRLIIDIDKNNIMLKNKFKFIMSILECKNKEKILHILICFLCDREYIFELRRLIKDDKKNRSIARFIKLKEEMTEFKRKLSLIDKFEKNYEEFKKIILMDEQDIGYGQEIESKDMEFLKDAYKKYVLNDIKKDKLFEENIEYIHRFCTNSEERRTVYPVLMFRIFTKYKKKLFDENLIITTKNFLNYKPYKIDMDNGKNFKTNSNYIKLFFELCNRFCIEDNLELNLFMFEKCSNLGLWYCQQNSENKDFSYSYESLLSNHIADYDTFFEEVSDYYDDDYINRGVKTENDGKEIIVTEDEYIDQMIEGALVKNEETGLYNEYVNYMELYAKGKRYALKYVEDLSDRILSCECEEFKKNWSFKRHVNYNVEFFLQRGCDSILNGEIVRFIEENHKFS